MKLLIVDDSLLIRERLSDLFEDIPEVDEIQSAGTLADARRIVDISRPDLTVLDVHLPDGNAIQSIRRMRELAPDMKMAVLTNDASSFNRKKCLEVGVSAFFDKSTEFELVVDVVMEVAAGMK